MKTMLFVCTANVCRSPMAEAMFNALVGDTGLPFQAQSAGTSALRGEEITPKAKAVLNEVGIRAGSHRARQVSETMLEEADLVLTMSPQHVAEIRGFYGSLPCRVYTLAEYANGPVGPQEISDPYGNTMVAYRACVRQLFSFLDLSVKRLAGER